MAKILTEQTTAAERMETDTPMSMVKTLCPDCAHLDRATGTTCAAFPDGIPLNILVGRFDHTIEYNMGGVSDFGVTFTAR